MKIYLLEDDIVFTNKFEELCKKLWHELTVCHTIESFEFQDYDVYLIDISFWKNVFSYDVIKNIRSKTNKTIAAFTQHEAPDILERSIDAWANYYIYKFQYNLYWMHLRILEDQIKSWK
jgi:GR25 family glycosyltransferase involved in LPS biosynthesis